MHRIAGNLQTSCLLRQVGAGIKALARAGAIAVLCILLLDGSTTAASADDNVPRQLTPARLSVADGDVSFWRPGAQDWVPAQLNTPLEPGDELYNGRGANAEVQIGPQAWARAGSETELGLDEEDPDYVQFKVTAGEAALDLRSLRPGQTVEVATPSGAVTIGTDGYYRVDVRDKATTVIARRGGQAAVIPAGGNEIDLASNQEVVIGGTETAAAGPQAAPPLDEWDGWNFGRTDVLLQARRDPHVSQDVYGGADLERYGHWRQVAPYGPVWVPADVRPGWTPYSDGHWVFDPHYGWTWIDDAPWGWAPFHYGRWVYNDDYWSWAPGPFVAAPAYAPALVAFFDVGPDIHIGIGAPALGWVPLGWGEPCIPWWGPSGFVGHPWWGGWHGPRIVNDRVINRMTIVHADEIHFYRNAAVRNAVIAAPRAHFFNAERHVVRFDSHEVGRADFMPVRGQLPVRPTVQALVPEGRGRGHAPPATVQNRPVVATRQPREPLQRLQAAGLHVPAQTTAPAPRIVEARHPNERVQRAAVPSGQQFPAAGRVAPGGRAEEARHAAQLPNESSHARLEQARPAEQPLHGGRDRRGEAQSQGQPPSPPGLTRRAQTESQSPPRAPARAERMMREEAPPRPPAQVAHVRPEQGALPPPARTGARHEGQFLPRESAPPREQSRPPREENRPAARGEQSSSPPMTMRRQTEFRAPERPQVEQRFRAEAPAPQPHVERARAERPFRVAPEPTRAPHPGERHEARAEHR
jgi:hypothetical protein